VAATLTVGGLPADRDALLVGTDQYSGLSYPRTLAITGPGGSYSIAIDTTTTISDLVAQVDAVRTTYGVQAGYDAVAGVLTVESERFGASGLSVEDTSGLGGAGILDDDDVTPGNGLLVPGANQTVDLTYTDLGGTLRTLTLTQDPAQDGGRTFTNLLGGPESAPPYTAFAPGAFRVTIADTTGGERGVDIAVPWSTEYYANRVSSVAIQSGDLASDRIPVDIPDMRAAALGRSANLTGLGLSSVESLANSKVLVTGRASEALRVIDAAITEVTTVRGRVGAIQSNAIEATLSTLRTGLENLASAESQLRDTDFAQESAEFARNQVIYQAATSMLAQANQIPQRIVELLRG
jgi:flagellin-like hook-associated protein FlgL